MQYCQMWNEIIDSGREQHLSEHMAISILERKNIGEKDRKVEGRESEVIRLTSLFGIGRSRDQYL